MKYYFFLFCLLLGPVIAYNQSYAISGTVQSAADESTFPGATVILLHPEDSSTVKGTITDFDGTFLLGEINKGKYLLRVQYLGYEPLNREITLDQNLNLGTLAMVEASTWLGEVTITESVAVSVQKGDTTQYNAAAFKTLKDASAQGLVEKMPGISMVDGNLQAQGENVVQILVDGKRFFGNDVKAALQNLPAEVIESIQIYDKASDKAEFSGFDDGEREKTINIITKPNRRSGQFGRTTLGYGSRGRYMAGTSVNAFNEDRRLTITALSNNINAQDYSADPNSQGESRTQNGIINTNSIGLNFSDDWGEKIEISGSYLFRQSNNDGETSLVRDYLLDSDDEQIYNEFRQDTRNHKEHRFDMRFDYDINDRNRIRMRPNVSFQYDRDNTFFDGRTRLNGDPLNQTANTYSANNSDYDFNNWLFYSHRFLKKGRSFTLSTHAGYHLNEDRADRDAENYYFGEEDRQELLNQYTERDRTGYHWNTNFSFTEPVGKKGQIELEYQVSNRLDDSDKITYDVLEEIDSPDVTFLPDTSLSNTFNSKYLSQEVELGYQLRGEKLRLQVEAQYQHSNLKNDQEFPLPFDLERDFRVISPTVRLDYIFSKSKKLEIDYDTRTNAPSIGQLQNVIDVSNPLQLRTGNPDLDQAFSHRIRTRYRSNNPETDQSFFLFMQTSVNNNYITNNTIIAEEPILLEEGIILEKGSQLTAPVNLDGYWDFRSYISYGKPVDFIKSNVNVNGGINFSHRPGMINNEISFVDNSNFRVGFRVSSNISEKIDFNFSTRSSFNMVENSLRPSLSNNYFSQSTSFSYDWIIGDGIVTRVDLNHRLNNGLAEEFDNSYLFVNMSIGTKFLKNDLGELSLNVYDLFKQNNNIQRNVSEFYIEDRQSNVLQRYFMLSFSYNLRHFSRGTSMDDYKKLHQSRGD
ncbi:MAG: TonB-dependent receptor [Saprospiraceae bacterium]|nr:TonB-dependent receptor [Lewinella sp.]